MSENVEEDIFEVVHKSEGKSRDKSGHISIETAVKGLVYRTNVYLNGFLIDAKEVSSIDLATLENGHSLFKQRYLATHYAFEQQYFMEKVFSKVLTNCSDNCFFIRIRTECFYHGGTDEFGDLPQQFGKTSPLS